jgi:hypothetical protein
MPTIPSPTSVATNVPGYSGQPVYGRDVSDAGAPAAAIGRVKNELVAIEQERYERNQREEIAKAQTDFQILMAQQNAAYDNDDDVDTIMGRYEENVYNGLSGIASEISDPRARDFFVHQNNLAIEQGKVRMQGVIHNKRSDNARAYAVAATDIIQKDAIAGGSMQFAQQSLESMYLSMAEQGFIDKELAQEAIINSRNTMAIGRLKTMPPEVQLQALNEDWAKELPLDVQVQLKDQAEAAMMNDEALSLAQGWMEEGLNMDQVNVELAKIKDSALFEKARTRILQLKNDDEAGLQEMQKELYEEYFSGVAYGDMKISDIPDLDKYGMSPAQITNLQSAETRAAKRAAGEHVPEYSNPEVVAKLRGHLARQELQQARKYFSENFAELNDSHFRYFESQVQPSMKNDGTGKALRTLNQTMNRLLRENGLEKDYAIENQIWDNLNRRFENYIQREGKVPTDREKNEWAKDEFLNIRRDPDAWFFDEDEYLFNMTEDERSDFWEAADLLRQTIPNITRDQIVERYEEMLRQRNASK